MRTIEERLKRLERLVSQGVFKPADTRKMLPELEVCIKYGISRERLKQLRLGYRGTPALLHNWTHIRGRKIEYEVQELARVLKRTGAKKSRSVDREQSLNQNV